jgi:hypothetical protein
MLQWLLTGAALVVSAVAIIRARRVARRLERLSEAYWELRYEHGQLSARLARFEQPGAPDPPHTEGAPIGAGRDAGVVGFVPLSSLKR